MYSFVFIVCTHTISAISMNAIEIQMSISMSFSMLVTQLLSCQVYEDVSAAVVWVFGDLVSFK